MVFFTPPIPLGQDFDEETQDLSLTVPRKVHYRNVWKDKQDVVLGECGLRTRSRFAILANKVQCSCH